MLRMLGKIAVWDQVQENSIRLRGNGGEGETQRQLVIMSGRDVCKASYRLRDLEEGEEGYPDGGRARLSCYCTPEYDPRLAWRRR